MNKNILIISSEFPPMPGGIGNHAFCLAKELSELGYKVTALTEKREQQQGEWQEFLNTNKKLDVVGLYRKRIIFLTYISRILYAYKLIRRNSYEAIIYSGKFSVWLNGLMPRTKSIVVIHGSEIKQKGFAKLLFRRGLQNAGCIVCVSSFTKDQLISNYKEIDSNRVVTINNGIEIHWFIDKPVTKFIDRNKLKLVTVGGIHRRKGQFNVVRSLPNIIESFPDAEYHVIGLPLEKGELVRLIEKTGVDKHVYFHHGLNDNQVKDVLIDSHIFLMLSEHLESGDFEGFGTAIIEAMALGLPAIGSKSSGTADAIKDGHSGKLIDSKDTDEVVNSLKEILSDHEQYSVNAKNWAKGFQWKNKVNEYQSLFNKL